MGVESGMAEKSYSEYGGGGSGGGERYAGKR